MPADVASLTQQLHMMLVSSCVSDLHVRLLAAAGAPRAFPVAQHAPHALHLRRRQVLVQGSFPAVLPIIHGAVP